MKLKRGICVITAVVMLSGGIGAVQAADITGSVQNKVEQKQEPEKSAASITGNVKTSTEVQEQEPEENTATITGNEKTNTEVQKNVPEKDAAVITANFQNSIDEQTEVLKKDAATVTGDILKSIEESEQEKNAVNVASFVLGSDPENAGAPVRERPELPIAEHKKIFKYTDNVVLKGIFEKNGYFFNVPRYWDSQYAYAQIEYTVSPLIQDVPASLTFFINDNPIYSCAVDYLDGESQITYVLIPTEYLKEGYNEFTLTGYVRLYDDDGCLDDFSGANWINIADTSFVEVGYDVIDTDHKICYYPYPMISTMDENGNDLTVYVPSGASEEELKAAFLLRADLGNETSDEDHIGFQTLDHFSGKKNSLIVALTKNLPAEVKDQMPGVSKITSEGAMVYEYGDGSSNILVVTAENGADLTEGVNMLMDEERVTQEKKSHAFVPSGASEQVLTNHSLNSLIENGETIKGITDSDGIEFIGPFHQEYIIYLPVSGGFVLGEGGKMDLRLRYSDNLDFDRSLITIYWGETPVASKKLEKEKASEDLFSFLMPSDVVGTHASSIKIAYDLEIEELYCTKRADEMPWGYVSGDSSLYLPEGNSSTYDLKLRPYPFQKLGKFNDLALVVPDSMTEEEYTLFGRTAALLGASVEPYGSVDVWFASSYPAESENRHIVTLGTWNDNVFIQNLNEKLSFAYTEEGERFADNEQLILSEDYAKTVGIMQIIRSPYQEKRAVLVVSACDEEGLTNIERFASVQENNWTLTGDAFLIDSDLETKSYRFLEEEEMAEVTLQERLAQHKDALIFTLAGTAAMLLILAATIIILVRFRRNKREEEKK